MTDTAERLTKLKRFELLELRERLADQGATAMVDAELARRDAKREHKRAERAGGLDVAVGGTRADHAERDAEIRRLRAEGLTSKEIGDRFGLHPGRVRSIWGPPPTEQQKQPRPPLRSVPNVPDDEWLDAEAEERPWRLDPELVLDAPPVKGIWHTDTGKALFVADAVNNIVADTGMGKTWCSLFAACEVIHAGGRVYWHNLDDSRPNTKTKILQLGLRDAFKDPEVFSYGEHDVSTAAQRLNIVRWLAEAIEAGQHGLYILDTLEAAGCDPTGGDISEWWAAWVSPFERAEGVTIALTDHEPRWKEGRGGAGGSGSQAKGARITGNGFMLRGNHGWTKQAGGHVNLMGDKSKTGDFAKGDHVATAAVTIGPHGEFIWTVRDAEPADGPPQAQRLSDRVLEWFEAHPEPISKTALAKAVRGNYKALIGIIGGMVASGQLVVVEGGKVVPPHLVDEPPRNTVPPEELF